MDTLTNDEIGLLLESLDAWEKAPTTGLLITTVFSSIIDDEDKAQASALNAQQRADMEIAHRKRKSTLLRVKLYQMQDEAVGTALFVQPQEN